MSQTRVRTTRPTSQRRGGQRGRGSVNQQKRNHNSGPYGNENLHDFEEGRGSQLQTNGNSNRELYKRGRGRFYEHNHNLKSNNIRELPIVSEVLGSELTQNSYNGETYKYVEGRRNKSIPKFRNKQQPVNSFSGGDECLLPDSQCKPPKHAQNHFFVSELMHRFQSVLPPSNFLSSEEPPQRILPYEGPIKTSNQNISHDFRTENKTLYCSKESNPHHPFMHSNIESHLLQLPQNKDGCKQNGPVKNEEKDITRPTSFKANVNSQQKKDAYRPKSEHSVQSSSLKQEAIPSQSSSHGNDKTTENQAQSSKAYFGDFLFSQIEAFGRSSKLQNSDKTNHYKNHTPETHEEQDLFSQIKSFVTSNKKNHPLQNESCEQTTHSSNSSECLSKSNKVISTPVTHNDQCTSSVQSKVFLENTPSSFTGPNIKNAQDEKVCKNSCSIANNNAEKISSGTDNCHSKINEKNKSIKDIEKRNKILKIFGLTADPSGHDIPEKQNSKSSLEVSAIPQVEPLDSNLRLQHDRAASAEPNVIDTLPSLNRDNRKENELKTRNISDFQDNNWPIKRSSFKRTSGSLPTGFQAHPITLKKTSNSAPETIKSDGTINMKHLKNSELIGGKVAGRNVNNIHRPVNNAPNKKVATRTEAINQMQDEYAEKLVEHQRKQQEKEAKKREEKLARYKHVDQGYRLTEGYLDEAAGGFDPIGNYPPHLDSEEEVRNRQQEQLRRDAVIYQEIERKKNEQLKKREEEKKKKEMEKYKHVSSGYKLSGCGNLDGNGAAQFVQSEEEIRLRQQELLRRDALIYQEREREKKEKLRKLEEEKRKKEAEKYKHLNSGYRLGGCVNLEHDGGRSMTQSPQLQRSQASQHLQSQKEPDGGRSTTQSPQLERSQAGQHLQSQKEPMQDIQEKPSMEDPSSKAAQASISEIEATFFKFLQDNGILSRVSTKEEEEARLTLLSQIQQVISSKIKTTDDKEGNSVENLPGTSKNTTRCAPVSCDSSKTPAASSSSLETPASCIVKSTSEGPLLVIRPSEGALKQAVSNKLALQELDKHGHSPLYTPHVEQAPVYSNNRFELQNSNQQHTTNSHVVPHGLNKVEQKTESQVVQRHSLQKLTDEDTGSISKETDSEIHSDAAPLGSTCSLDEQGLRDTDFLEELRAARLRMQKKYDEALKKQQQNV